MKNLYAVILAGGSGTRFWPMSRKKMPKQFLNVTQKGSLLEETLMRIKVSINPKQIFIVTGQLYQKEIKRQTKKFKIPASNILLEPNGKNTAPAICWAAAKIHKLNSDAIMAVLPSDHLILNRKKYTKLLNDAAKLANKDFLVTFGIVPTRPETGYGYLKTLQRKGVLRVDKFTEKPNLAKAKQFVKNKSYLWNSGMFVWKTSVILSEFKQYLPKVYNLVGTKSSSAHIKKVWSKLPSVSIDYGILEKSKDVAAIRAQDIGWSDLGSWESLTEVLSTDKKGNIQKGDVIPIDNRGSLIWANDRVVAGIGLEDIIVIDTPDALLVCHKSKSQHVKDIVEHLKNKKRSEI